MHSATGIVAVVWMLVFPRPASAVVVGFGGAWACVPHTLGEDSGSLTVDSAWATRRRRPRSKQAGCSVCSTRRFGMSFRAGTFHIRAPELPIVANTGLCLVVQTPDVRNNTYSNSPCRHTVGGNERCLVGRCAGTARNFGVRPTPLQTATSGKQYLESTVPVSEPGLILLYIQRPWPVEINSRTGTNATHSN